MRRSASVRAAVARSREARLCAIEKRLVRHLRYLRRRDPLAHVALIQLRAEHAWVKLHVMIGTVTNVVTGIRVSSEADCPLLPALLTQTARQFRVKGVSADKAYLSKKNLAAIDKVGAVPFIPFKSNSVGMSSKSEPWKRMWCHFTLKSEEFRAHYHRRSNVEATMWMIKSKFGGDRSGPGCRRRRRTRCWRTCCATI